MSSPSRKIILLSSSTKESSETAAKVICENFPFSMHLKLSEPLKNAVHALYGKSCAHNAYDKHQGSPHQDFLGLSPHQAYNQMADWIKKCYGMEFCANILCRIIENFGSKRLFVISELEHPDQAQPLIELVGQENVLHLSIHPETQELNQSLTSDVKLPKLRTHQVANPQDREHLLKNRIYDYVHSWIEDRDGFKGFSRVA